MQIHYDAKTDLLYLRLDDRKQKTFNRRVSEDIVLDLGEGDRIVGIEILDASRRLDVEELLPAKQQPSKMSSETTRSYRVILSTLGADFPSELAYLGKWLSLTAQEAELTDTYAALLAHLNRDRDRISKKHTREESSLAESLFREIAALQNIVADTYTRALERVRALECDVLKQQPAEMSREIREVKSEWEELLQMARHVFLVDSEDTDATGALTRIRAHMADAQDTVAIVRHLIEVAETPRPLIPGQEQEARTAAEVLAQRLKHLKARGVEFSEIELSLYARQLLSMIARDLRTA